MGITSVQPCELPALALLSRYATDGAYVDSYCVELERVVSQEEFVEAFYTTFVFRLERFILKWLVSRPSSDAEVRALALGATTSFAAWCVEDRNSNQLLLADFMGHTRSWLMTSPAASDKGEAHTRLYFGSAVVPRLNAKTGKQELGPTHSSLLGFHKLYSRVLLAAARSRLQARGAATRA